MRIDKERSFRKNGQILYKEIEGAGVLIDPYRRTLVHLNPMASLIWQLLDNQRTPASIVEAVKAEFAVDAKELEKDVNKLLNELLKREMIE